MGKELRPIDEVRQTITRLEPQFKNALPSHVSVEKFMRVVMTAISQEPKLIEADRQSLYAACLLAAQDGLMPDKREAALVPYKGKVKYLPMYQGILKKVRNSGELLSITAQVVCQGDVFRYWVDTDGEHLLHEPIFFGDRGIPLGVYAIAKTKDGGVYIEPMTKDQVMDIKNVSPSKDTGAWSGDFASEMWRKSVIRRIAKRLPISSDLERILREDDELFIPPQEADKPALPESKSQSKQKTSRLAKLVAAKAEVTVEAEPTSRPSIEESDQPI